MRNYGQGLVGLAGFILIAAGILSLYLSDQVVTGWWQGTLDAFGVGFIIAGVVDVLAISALNQRIKADEERRKANNRMAKQILRSKPSYGQAKDAADLLLDADAEGRIDPHLYRQLIDVANPPPESPDDQ